MPQLNPLLGPLPAGPGQAPRAAVTALQAALPPPHLAETAAEAAKGAGLGARGVEAERKPHGGAPRPQPAPAAATRPGAAPRPGNMAEPPAEGDEAQPGREGPGAKGEQPGAAGRGGAEAAAQGPAIRPRWKPPPPGPGAVPIRLHRAGGGRAAGSSGRRRLAEWPRAPGPRTDHAAGCCCVSA